MKVILSTWFVMVVLFLLMGLNQHFGWWPGEMRP